MEGDQAWRQPFSRTQIRQDDRSLSNDVDPQAWLADILARIAEMPQARLPEFLPSHWKADRQQALAAYPSARRWIMC